MATRKYFALPLLLLALSSCHTGRMAHRGSTTHPDAPLAQAQMEVTGQSAQAEKQEETVQDTPSRVRIHVNKVESRSADTWQGKLQQRLDSIANIDLFETTQLGMCVYDLTEDTLLYAVNANQRMRPASNQKLVTAITALDQLPSSLRFTPTVLKPGWGWCWDDAETGMTDFKANGKRRNADTLYCERREWTLQEVLTPMMKKSDNMLAESVFWQLPGSGNLSKLSRKNCVEKVDLVLGKAGVTGTDYTIADGSGVSLYNYLTPHLLLKLLCYAYQEKAIFNLLYPALPIAGIDGTLEKRMRGTRAEANVHAKTGTVTGVSTLSGYCTHPTGHILAFSIMNQGLPKASIGRAYQDEVCEILCGQEDY